MMFIDFELRDLNELPSITREKKYTVFVRLKSRNRRGYFS